MMMMIVTAWIAGSVMIVILDGLYGILDEDTLLAVALLWPVLIALCVILSPAFALAAFHTHLVEGRAAPPVEEQSDR